MDPQQLFPTLEGTPQGGVISPLLANTALPGVMRYNKNRLKKYTNESIFSRFAFQK
jgi:RNA-directed DNA polymerase